MAAVASRRSVNDPYITFSNDMRYAFVEHTPQIRTRGRALTALDRYLRNGPRPEIPPLEGWSVDHASVVGLEIWDEHTGRCHSHPTIHTRTLWRITVDDAFLCTDVGNAATTDDLLATLRALNHSGRLHDETLDRIHILVRRFHDAEHDRQQRQAARPAGAPRARLAGPVGATLARTLLALIIQLETGAPSTGWKSVESSLTAALDSDTESQIAELRNDLDTYGRGPA